MCTLLRIAVVAVKQRRKLKSETTPEELLQNTDNPSMINAFLHENYLPYFTDLDDAVSTLVRLVVLNSVSFQVFLFLFFFSPRLCLGGSL